LVTVAIAAVDQGDGCGLDVVRPSKRKNLIKSSESGKRAQPTKIFEGIVA